MTPQAGSGTDSKILISLIYHNGPLKLMPTNTQTMGLPGPFQSHALELTHTLQYDYKVIAFL